MHSFVYHSSLSQHRIFPDSLLLSEHKTPKLDQKSGMDQSDHHPCFSARSILLRYSRETHSRMSLHLRIGRARNVADRIVGLASTARSRTALIMPLPAASTLYVTWSPYMAKRKNFLITAYLLSMFLLAFCQLAGRRTIVL